LLQSEINLFVVPICCRTYRSKNNHLPQCSELVTLFSSILKAMPIVFPLPLEVRRSSRRTFSGAFI